MNELSKISTKIGLSKKQLTWKDISCHKEELGNGIVISTDSYGNQKIGRISSIHKSNDGESVRVYMKTSSEKESERGTEIDLYDVDNLEKIRITRINHGFVCCDLIPYMTDTKMVTFIFEKNSQEYINWAKKNKSCYSHEFFETL